MKVNHFTTTVGLNNQFNQLDFQQQKPQTSQDSQQFVEQNFNKEDVLVAVNNVNNFLEPVTTNLKFVFHEELHEYYVTIINPQTNEVVKEVPPKKMLDMYVAMAKYMGLLVDEKI